MFSALLLTTVLGLSFGNGLMAMLVAMPSPPPATKTPPVNHSLDELLLKGIGPPAAQHAPAARPANTSVKTPAESPAHVSGLVSPRAGMLARIEEKMRIVHDRLGQCDLSANTLDTEQRIVTELDQLIAELERQCCKGDKQSSCKSSAACNKKGQEKPGKKPAGRQAARSIAEAVGSGGQASGNESNLQAAVGKIWGQLPERVRQQVQNVTHLEFLPQYRKLIEDYYRRLAEQPE